jgi:nucleoside-diphosphate-sugar epimerase
MHSHLHDRRTLVTGATGYVGGLLCAALKRAGARVAATSRTATSGTQDGVRWIPGDLTEADFVERLVRESDPEYVFHLAAFKKRASGLDDFRAAIDTNFQGVVHLASACQSRDGFLRFVAMGTCEEYGPSATPFREALREAPANAYALSKLAATHFLQASYSANAFPAVILRPSLAYGPGQADDMMLPALIRSLIAGRTFPMTLGAQTRDYVYIDDLIQAMLLSSGAADICGRVINISSGEPVSVRDMALRVASLVGGQATSLLGLGELAYRHGEAMNYWAAPDVARTVLGWQPATPLAEGLKRTVDYYRMHSGSAHANGR